MSNNSATYHTLVEMKEQRAEMFLRQTHGERAVSFYIVTPVSFLCLLANVVAKRRIEEEW